MSRRGRLPLNVGVLETLVEEEIVASRHGGRGGSGGGSLVRACADARSFALGKRLHARLVDSGCDRGCTRTANQLVQLYARCEHLGDARALFRAIPVPDTSSWNTILGACAKDGRYQETLELFREMTTLPGGGGGLVPDKVTFLPVLSACAQSGDLEQAKVIHECMIRECVGTGSNGGFERDETLMTAVVNMYGRCGSAEDARAVFDRLRRPPDTIAWTSMIAAYSRNGRSEDALELLRQMLSEGVRPDRVTLLRGLDACTASTSLATGQLLHETIDSSNELQSDPALRIALLRMYARCGSLNRAQIVFDAIPPPRGVIAYTSLIAAYTQSGENAEALRTYKQMESEEGTEPDLIVHLSALNACSRPEFLLNGRAIHRRIESSYGSPPDVLATRALVHMYSRCGAVSDARAIFNLAHHRDTALWNAMIAMYAQSGQSKEALSLFFQMDSEEGVKPDKVTFLIALDICSDAGSLETCRIIHRWIDSVRNFDPADLALKTALLTAYGKCGGVEEATAIFDTIQERDVVTWTAMIAAYAQNRYRGEALGLYYRMEAAPDVKPNRVTIITVINACAGLASPGEGRVIHARVVTVGLDSDIAALNSLLSMYGKCGDLKTMQMLFERMWQHRDVVSWNAVIAAYAENDCGGIALDLLRQMDSESTEPDKITFLALLDACSMLASIEAGRVIHERIVSSALESDAALKNALINMYSKCGSLADACAIFETIPKPNVVSWNSMIAAYAENERGNEALKLFRRFSAEGLKPDRITFLNIANACINSPGLTSARTVHEAIIAHGFNTDVAVMNALLHIYSKCGSLMEARSVFDGMQSRDVITWTTMMTAYAQNGNSKEALALLLKMELEGLKPTAITFLSALSACNGPGFLDTGQKIHKKVVACEFGSDIAVQNALLYMYGMCGCPKAAQSLFDIMRERNVVSWTALIAAYTKEGCDREALQLFQKMLSEGIRPNEITFLGILDACTCLASLEMGRAVHKHIIACGFDSHVALKTSLLNLYGKCGGLTDAIAVFDELRGQIEEDKEEEEGRDVIAWNAMIAAYAHNGCSEEAIRLLCQMESEGVKPNQNTFHSILNACSHAGLLDQCWQCFVSMRRDYGVALHSEHYLCMIALCARAGHSNETEDVMRNMHIQPGDVAWTTLLGACQADNSNMERAINNNPSFQMYSMG